MSLDLYILFGYFIFMGFVGFVFHSFSKSTSDYFRGGGSMLWWMIGATAFMNQFSAWTFTGAASKAYSDGITVIAIFFGNALGYFLNAHWSAKKFRRLNVITPIEAVKLRYGNISQQFFTWASFPIKLIQAGIWLSGLGLFMAAILGFSLNGTIIITGCIVMLVSLVGGSWAIVASDFMQMLVVMVVAVVTTIYALVEGGGITHIVHKFPHNFIHGDTLTFTSVFFLWVIAMLIKQFASTNNMIDSYRFLGAKDIKNARKGAYLAGFLMLVGPVIWFIPPWLSASMYPDLHSLYPALKESKVGETAYLVFVQQSMPAGMTGLLMASIFAATMSSMDTGLNQNAGTFTRNFYLAVLRPHASDKELMRVAKISTAVFGILIILIAIFITNLKGMSLFKAMQLTSSLIATPLLVPLILGFVVKGTPKWASWATVVFGLCVSFVVVEIPYNTAYYICHHVLSSMPGSIFPLPKDIPQVFSSREHSDLLQLVGVFAHLIITSGFFLATKLFYNKDKDPVYHQLVDDFFHIIGGKDSKIENLSHSPVDAKQRALLGKLVMLLGFVISLLCLVHNSIYGRFAFILCGGLVFLVGVGLFFASKKTFDEVETK